MIIKCGSKNHWEWVADTHNDNGPWNQHNLWEVWIDDSCHIRETEDHLHTGAKAIQTTILTSIFTLYYMI